MDLRMDLRIYGDFNCPFSRLASWRAARLEAAGIATVDWRAVEHDPAVPAAGQPVVGALADEIASELDQIRGLLREGESPDLALPPLRPNTAASTAAYAAVAPDGRGAAREALFSALWGRGLDIGDPEVLGDLGLDGRDPELAAAWRSEWLGLDRPIVPVMALPDGRVSRGLGALQRLADLLSG
jgi:predicted DsbA family dithiol-disulfide isomerase